LIHLPTDKDEMLTRHLQSEQEVTVRKRGSAGYEKKWTKRKGFDANHLLDCTVYAYAIAYALKLFRLPDNAPLYGVVKPQTTEEQAQQADSQPQKPKPAPEPKPAPARKQYLPLIQNYLGRR